MKGTNLIAKKAAPAKNAAPAKKGAAKKVVASKKAASAEKAPAKQAKGITVRRAILPGGYVVFGTPVEPKHTTRAKIAAAIASIE